MGDTTIHLACLAMKAAILGSATTESKRAESAGNASTMVVGMPSSIPLLRCMILNAVRMSATVICEVPRNCEERHNETQVWREKRRWSVVGSWLSGTSKYSVVTIRNNTVVWEGTRFRLSERFEITQAYPTLKCLPRKGCGVIGTQKQAKERHGRVQV